MTEQQENLFSLEGKVALVTGASSGLGKHFAKVLAAAGADIAVVARRTEKLDELVKELSDSGAKSFATAMDVTSAASVDEAISAIENELGTVTTLINNAGVADSRHCLKVDEESWDFVMNTNLKGALCRIQQSWQHHKYCFDPCTTRWLWRIELRHVKGGPGATNKIHGLGTGYQGS